MPKAHRMKNGKWRCQVYLGDKIVDGKRKQIIKSFTAGTRAEAEDMASEYRRTHGQKAVEDLTVGDAIDRYIDQRDKVLSPTTIKAYKSMKRGVLSDLTSKRIKDVSSGTMQAWVNSHTEKTPKTLRNAHALAVSAISAVDPAFRSSVTFPRKIKKETHVPTKEEVELLISNADEDTKKAILLAAYCSLRRSEACAVTMEDIDFKKGWISVNKTMVMKEGGAFIVKPYTKTEESRRETPAPPEVLEAMKTGPISCNPSSISHRFERLVIKCDLPHIRYHDLRHFFASYLHAKGIPDAYIEKFGGWRQGSQVMKTIYRESLKDEEKKQADKIIKIFANNALTMR